MSRSGYDDNCDGWGLIRWRGAVASAIRGKRGQAFLKEMLAALDALESKRLIVEVLELRGEVCALGAVGRARGIPMSDVDSYDYSTVTGLFGIPDALAREIMFENDDGGLWTEPTPEQRFARMRVWAESRIVATETTT